MLGGGLGTLLAAGAIALVRVLEEDGLARELRRLGFEQAARFTWERTAEGFASVLDGVVA